MLYNNLKMAFRYLVRNKAVSTIKIIGLAVALAFCILVYFYVDHENSFDRFHPGAERVYRMTITNGEGDICEIPAVYGPEAIKQFPEINEYNRLYTGGCLVKIDGDVRSINQIYADSNFFSFFHFPLKTGDPRTILADPSHAILSEQAATSLFGSTEIIGKTVSVSYAGNYHDYVISGIASNAPGNSSISFDIILPMQRLFAIGDVEHMNRDNRFATFIRIKENANIGALRKKINPLTKQFRPLEYERGWGIGLQNMLDIHFSEQPVNYYNTAALQGNKNTLYILSSIALILLIVGCINFIIISIGSSIQRNKELGIRKTIGADKSQLVRQSYYESLLVTAIAVAIGLLLAFLLLPIFNQLLQVHIEASRILNLHTFAFLFALLILTSIFAGSWSFLMISKYEIHSLFGGGFFSSKKSRFQAICVIFQIIIAMIFLTSTFVMYQQSFLIKKKADQINDIHAVCIDMNLSWQEMQRGKSIIDIFRIETLKNPNIRSVSAVQMHNFYYNKEQTPFRNFKCDENEASAYKLEVDSVVSQRLKNNHELKLNKIT